MARRNANGRAAVTISHVAEASGVSRATVSRVVNGNASVKPEIAERVRSEIARLGYEPSPVAQSLSLGRTSTVGMVVPDLGNPTFQSILHGVNQAAASAGYRVLVADSGESDVDEPAIVEDLRRRTDAVIVCSPRMSAESLNAVIPRVVPAVVVNRDEPVPAARVVVDYAAGIVALGRHLVDLGHRRILHLDGPPGSNAQAARAVGLATLAHTYPDLVVLREPCGATIAAGEAAFERARASGATAVIGFNDLVALGLMGRAAEHGWRVPDDVSIAGFDDIPFAHLSRPGLTTVHVALESVGEAAWGALSHQFAEAVGADFRSFTPVLVVRGSTGPALPG
ncbi:LacI family DNA-binding transcriptional regulator [uncultured Demequina sp.]|uniref:LacI family DNA-binding transcriptional regulator n=1 Tax=uncultured Demequina sp. TaxID=693499 RepID=UPI0025F74D99|nr:LacI family DNA-binding transcriptional regulator [uncultured Demequina sp.]